MIFRRLEVNLDYEGYIIMFEIMGEKVEIKL